MYIDGIKIILEFASSEFVKCMLFCSFTTLHNQPNLTPGIEQLLDTPVPL